VYFIPATRPLKGAPWQGGEKEGARKKFLAFKLHSLWIVSPGNEKKERVQERKRGSKRGREGAREEASEGKRKDKQ